MKHLPLLLLLAAGAFAQTPAAPAKRAVSAAKPAVAAKPPAPPRDPGLYAIMTTSMGPMTMLLYEKEAPVTVKNFIDLARGRKQWKDQKTGQMVRRPLYPGTTFHRVIPGFMIQGGDPTGSGAGNPGFVIPDEFAPTLKFDRPGRLAMANAGPHTGNCQFFITEGTPNHLNGAHTIFGQVVEGLELVGKIARVPRGAMDKPNTPVRIVSIAFKREGPVPPNAPEGIARPVAKKSAGTARKGVTPAAKKAAKPAATQQ
jgi:peptidyl-prolyl cis-trans isomerase A (cyclophilin A)